MAKRLVIFVEGKGDVAAIPTLAQRVVNERVAHDALFVDHEAYRVRGIATLVKNQCYDWRRWLNSACATRRNLGAVLLVLDGDLDNLPQHWATYSDRFGSAFCAFRTAAMLGEEARATRAGEAYSLASVFVMREFEAWLLAGIESLRGKPLSEGRGTVPMNAAFPAIELENKRDAEGALRQIISRYSKTLDQGVLARDVDFNLIRSRSRSFCRFCSAIGQLVDAIRDDAHIVTPTIAV